MIGGNPLFYVTATVAVGAILLAVSRANAVHALLYLVVGVLALAVVFLLLGAPFAAALQVIIYAGAIVVLFLFVVMMLGAGPDAAARERRLLRPRAWLGPSLLALALGGALCWMIGAGTLPATGGVTVGPKAVALALWGPYAIAAELAGLLLLAALVGAYRIGRASGPGPENEETTP